MLPSAKRVSLLFLSFALAGLLAPAAAADLFPRFEAIAPNVAFWKTIYAHYTTRQAVLHDSHDLGIVYEVVAVEPYDAPGARKINRERLKRAKAKYRRILDRLAADPAAPDADSRRVAALFGTGAQADDFRRASGQIRSQLGQKDRFRAGLIRSGAYLEEIRSILKSHGVPEDLAYLPHVESSFNPSAYSKFGAAGIWQFTRSTGRRFMTVDYVMDERRDPIRATYAAARLLAENHARLGSWPLAITAYNHGAAGMARAKTKHGDYPAVFRNYRSRTFKFASRNFYAEFLAARDVAANYAAHFGPLTMARPTPTRTVTLAGFAHIDDLSAHFGIDPEALRRMNPALRPPVFSGQKYVPQGYRLRLPAEGSESVTLAAIPSTLYKSAQKPSRFYTVQRGDTAGRIARTHGVRLNDLILANNLGTRATIYPKQTLRIPLAGETLTASATPSPAPVQVAAASAKTAPPEEAPAATPEPPSVPSAETEGVPESLPAPIQASVLPLPTARKEAFANVEASPAMPAAEIVSVDVRFQHTDGSGKPAVGLLRVEVEETLGHYAEWAGVRTQAIRRLNGLPYGRTLRLHQEVKIPLAKVSAAAFEEQRYEYHKRLQEDFFAVYRVSELDPYRVRAGDNIWTLCRDRFEVPMWLLKHYNMDADLAALQVQQTLRIPVIAATASGEPGTVTSEADPGDDGPLPTEAPPLASEPK